MFKRFFRYHSSIKLVLLTTLLINITMYMVVPFLAIYLQQINTLTSAQIGLILGIAFWCQRAGSFFGGIMSDYLHVKGTMIFGLLVRIPGYLLLGHVCDFYLLLICCILISLGSSIYVPAAKSFLVKTVSDDEKIDVLATRTIFANIGGAVGPVAGMAIFSFSPAILFTIVGVSFLLFTFLNCKLKPPLNGYTNQALSLGQIFLLLKNKSMLSVALFTFIVTSLYIQLEVTIPIKVSQSFGTSLVSFIFIINAAIVIFFQSLVSTWACNQSSKLPFILIFILYMFCFLIISFTNYYSMILLAVILFSFAQIISQIRLDFECTNIRSDMVATAFGITSLAGAFGGLFGSYFGNFIYNNGLLGFSVWEWLSILSFTIALLCYFQPILTAKISKVY
ncbi:MFS transporter [Bartonella sp. DGB1]|uniref:MFS transporter n=1 Tax=Bartonella sp. DGB1 TaxID=3239807 RepID=UPI003523D20D